MVDRLKVNIDGLSMEEFNRALQLYGNKISERVRYNELKEQEFSRLSRMKPLPTLDMRSILSSTVSDDYHISQGVVDESKGQFILAEIPEDEIVDYLYRLTSDEEEDWESGVSDEDDEELLEDAFESDDEVDDEEDYEEDDSEEDFEDESDDEEPWDDEEEFEDEEDELEDEEELEDEDGSWDEDDEDWDDEEPWQEDDDGVLEDEDAEEEEDDWDDEEDNL